MWTLILLAVFAAPACLEARTPFIIGGNDVATPGLFPWQGSLQMNGRHICGCSLISQQFVLTAGHCIMAEDQTVILGAHKIQTGSVVTEPSRKRYSILSKIKHPDFDGGAEGVPNDIALIKLSERATLNDQVKPIALAPSTATDADYSGCSITGWGAVKMIVGIFPRMPDVLQEAAVGVYTKTKCVQMLERVIGAKVLDSHICVGKEHVSGACSGDSGGPLTCKVGGNVVQAGLTSWGVSTCGTEFPSVYTRISSFRSWIDDNMK